MEAKNESECKGKNYVIQIKKDLMISSVHVKH